MISRARVGDGRPFATATATLHLSRATFPTLDQAGCPVEGRWFSPWINSGARFAKIKSPTRALSQSHSQIYFHASIHAMFTRWMKPSIDKHPRSHSPPEKLLPESFPVLEGKRGLYKFTRELISPECSNIPAILRILTRQIASRHGDSRSTFLPSRKDDPVNARWITINKKERERERVWSVDNDRGED